MGMTHEGLCQLHEIISRAVIFLPLCSSQREQSVECSEMVHEADTFTKLKTKGGSLNWALNYMYFLKILGDEKSSASAVNYCHC